MITPFVKGGRRSRGDLRIKNFPALSNYRNLYRLSDDPLLVFTHL